MSFDINWEKLTTDNQINDSIKNFLHEQFQSLQLPSYISNLEVVDFKLGTIPPEITIRHIGDPFEEFYANPDDGNGDGNNDEEVLKDKSTKLKGRQAVNIIPNNAGATHEADIINDHDYGDEDDIDDDYDNDSDDYDDDENDGLHDHGEDEENEESSQYDEDRLSNITEGLSLVELSASASTPKRTSPQRPPLISPRGEVTQQTLSKPKEPFQSILNPYGVTSVLNQGSNAAKNTTATSIAAGTTAANGVGTLKDIFDQNNFSSRVIPKIKTKQESVSGNQQQGKQTGKANEKGQKHKHEHEEEQGSDKQNAKNKASDDVQLILEINYKGNLYIDLLVTLLVNYPSPNFISLPIKLHVTDLVIHTIATIAYLKHAVYVSFLCDVNDEADGFSGASSNASTPNVTGTTSGGGNSGGNIVDYYFSDPNNKERIDIIKKIKIESEIGEVENNILRNVGKVEKFLMEQLRAILRDEIAWPSWICVDMAENDDDDEEEDDDDDHDEDNEGRGRMRDTGDADVRDHDKKEK